MLHGGSWCITMLQDASRQIIMPLRFMTVSHDPNMHHHSFIGLFTNQVQNRPHATKFGQADSKTRHVSPLFTRNHFSSPLHFDLPGLAMKPGPVRRGSPGGEGGGYKLYGDMNWDKKRMHEKQTLNILDNSQICTQDTLRSDIVSVISRVTSRAQHEIPPPNCAVFRFASVWSIPEYTQTIGNCRKIGATSTKTRTTTVPPATYYTLPIVYCLLCIAASLPIDWPWCAHVQP